MSRSLPKPKKVPRRDRVVVSWLFPDQVSGHFMISMLNMLNYDLHVAGGRIQNGGTVFPVTSGANITTARNKQVSGFLDDSDADWLLIVDSDMTFPPDALETLIVNADPVEAPIVGGLCFGVRDDSRGLEYWPTMYQFDVVDDELLSYRIKSWEPDSMFPVHATGAAFILIHRTVLESMRVKFAERAPWIWFEEQNHNGRPWGEDMTFCLRAIQCGFPIYVHTGVHIGHMKTRKVTVDTYNDWKAS